MTATSAYPFVVISPAKRFGQPNIGGISVEVLAGMVWAGEAPSAVADDFDLTTEEVLLACWFQGEFGTRTWRKRWREWARRIGPALAKRSTLDLDAVEWPPTRTTVGG